MQSALNYYFPGGKNICIFGFLKKIYVILFMFSSSFFRRTIICWFCVLYKMSDRCYTFFKKHDSLENKFYKVPATNIVCSHLFFNSSLNNASTSATSLNIWWVLSTLACGSFVPKTLFFFRSLSAVRNSFLPITVTIWINSKLKI